MERMARKKAFMKRDSLGGLAVQSTLGFGEL